MPDAYVEISLSALRENAAAVIAAYPEYSRHIAVVKGDAYGHGMRAAQALYEGGMRMFAVSSIDEAKALREYVDADILCLEPVELDRLSEAHELRMTLPICDMSYLEAFLSAAGDLSFKLHLQIDAGFNRLGFKDADEVAQAAELIKGSPHTLEGVYQHFATVGINDSLYDAQIARFTELTQGLDLSAVPLVHLSSGVTMLAHPKVAFATAARMGLILYGYNVSPSSCGTGIGDRLRAARDHYRRKKDHLTPTIYDVPLALKPAMRFRCRILQLKDVKRGERIGYGGAYQAREDMRIAILPVGYGSGIGHLNRDRQVLIKGRLYPVVGAVGMNMLAVKADGMITLSDEVTLLGDGITPGMFSRASGLGLAEALVMIGRCNPRVYVD